MNEMMEMAMGFEEKNLPIKHIPGPEVPAAMTLPLPIICLPDRIDPASVVRSARS